MMTHILRGQDMEDITLLRNNLSTCHGVAVPRGTLHTSQELKDIIARLGNEAERMGELDEELHCLREKKKQSEDQIKDLEEKIELYSKKADSASEWITETLGGIIYLPVLWISIARLNHLGGKKSILEVERDNARARVEELQGKIDEIKDEQESGIINRAKLEKAREDMEELNSLTF